MEEFDRRVENWFVEVIWIVFDILAVTSDMMLRMFRRDKGGSHAWKSCGEGCFLAPRVN